MLGANLPGLGEASRTEPPGSVGLCFSRASPYQASQNSPPSPPSAFPRNSIRGDVEEGQAFYPRNIPFQLLRPVGIPAKDRGPRELTPGAPTPSRAGASGALFQNIALAPSLYNGLS